MRQPGEGHGPADRAQPYQGPTRPGSPAHLVLCQSDRADTLHPNPPAHPRMNQEPSLPLRPLQVRRRWRKSDPINGESTGESQRTSATNHGARAKTAIYQICPVSPQRRTWKLKVFSTLGGMPSFLNMTNCFATNRYSYCVFLLHPPAHIRHIFIPPTIIYSRLFQDLLAKDLSKSSTSRCDLYHFLCRGNLRECHSVSESSKPARSFWSWFRKRDARCHHQPARWWRPLSNSHSPHQHRRISAVFPTLCSTSTPGACHRTVTLREDFSKNETKNLLHPSHSRRTDAPRRPNNIPTHRLAFPRRFSFGTVIYRRRWQQPPPDPISLPSTISTILNTYVDSPISFGKVLPHKSTRRA